MRRINRTLQSAALATLLCLITACGPEEARPQAPRPGEGPGGSEPIVGGPQPIDMPRDRNDMSPDLDEPTFDPEAPPAESGALFEYLREGAYTSLRDQSALQNSTSHERGRTFMNARLHRSLAASEGDNGFVEHPVGSAAVKALYDSNDALLGWVAMIKVASNDGIDGAGWFWYENLSTTRNTPQVAEPGSPLCSTCHAQGVDFVATELPLR